MANLSLTEQEGNALIQLLDIAVKSQGLNVAEAGVILVKKVQESFKPVTPTKVEGIPVETESTNPPTNA